LDFCTANAGSIAHFSRRQRAAFTAEREDWIARGIDRFDEPDLPNALPEDALPPGARSVASPVPGSVWQVLKAPGETVALGEPLLILESMKMEVRVPAPATGRLITLTAVPGAVVRAGQRLGVIQPE